MIYGDDVDFKFVSDVGDLGYKARPASALLKM